MHERDDQQHDQGGHRDGVDERVGHRRSLGHPSKLAAVATMEP
jgi:hypothetical protein